MLEIKTIVFIIIGIYVFITILNVLFNFLGIEFSSYANYLLWMIALVIFYLVLPSKNESIFT